jgi:hypothetical protein
MQTQAEEASVEVNVTSPEPSDCDSAAEEREEEAEEEEEARGAMEGDRRMMLRDVQGIQPGNHGGPSCKRFSPSPGETTLR